MNQGWQSESTGGPKVVEVVFFRVVEIVAVVTSPQLLDAVVQCSCSCR